VVRGAHYLGGEKRSVEVEGLKVSTSVSKMPSPSLSPSMATGTALLEGDPRPSSKPRAEQTITEDEAGKEVQQHLESRLRRKVDLRLCTMAGILCSLNLLDSGIISSASVTRLVHTLRPSRCY